MADDKQQNSISTLGMSMRRFGRSLMRHYTRPVPELSTPIEQVTPYQTMSTSPLNWDGVVQPKQNLRPALAEDLPPTLDDVFEPPVQPIQQVPQPQTPIQRQPQKKSLDPRLKQILDLHAKRDAERAEKRVQRRNQIQDSLQTGDNQQPTPDIPGWKPKPRASFDYLETSTLIRDKDDKPTTPEPNKDTLQRASDDATPKSAKRSKIIDEKDFNTTAIDDGYIAANEPSFDDFDDEDFQETHQLDAIEPLFDESATEFQPTERMASIEPASSDYQNASDNSVSSSDRTRSIQREPDTFQDPLSENQPVIEIQSNDDLEPPTPTINSLIDNQPETTKREQSKPTSPKSPSVENSTIQRTQSNTPIQRNDKREATPQKSDQTSDDDAADSLPSPNINTDAIQRQLVDNWDTDFEQEVPQDKNDFQQNDAPISQENIDAPQSIQRQPVDDWDTEFEQDSLQNNSDFQQNEAPLSQSRDVPQSIQRQPVDDFDTDFEQDAPQNNSDFQQNDVPVSQNSDVPQSIQRQSVDDWDTEFEQDAPQNNSDFQPNDAPVSQSRDVPQSIQRQPVDDFDTDFEQDAPQNNSDFQQNDVPVSQDSDAPQAIQRQSIDNWDNDIQQDAPQNKTDFQANDAPLSQNSDVPQSIQRQSVDDWDTEFEQDAPQNNSDFQPNDAPVSQSRDVPQSIQRQPVDDFDTDFEQDAPQNNSDFQQNDVPVSQNSDAPQAIQRQSLDNWDTEFEQDAPQNNSDFQQNDVPVSQNSDTPQAIQRQSLDNWDTDFEQDAPQNNSDFQQNDVPVSQNSDTPQAIQRQSLDNWDTDFEQNTSIASELDFDSPAVPVQPSNIYNPKPVQRNQDVANIDFVSDNAETDNYSQAKPPQKPPIVQRSLGADGNIYYNRGHIEDTPEPTQSEQNNNLHTAMIQAGLITPDTPAPDSYSPPQNISSESHSMDKAHTPIQRQPDKTTRVPQQSLDYKGEVRQTSNNDQPIIQRHIGEDGQMVYDETQEDSTIPEQSMDVFQGLIQAGMLAADDMPDQNLNQPSTDAPIQRTPDTSNIGIAQNVQDAMLQRLREKNQEVTQQKQANNQSQQRNHQAPESIQRTYPAYVQRQPPIDMIMRDDDVIGDKDEHMDELARDVYKLLNKRLRDEAERRNRK